MKYKKEVEEFISENFSGYNFEVLINDFEQYMVSIDGIIKSGFTSNISFNLYTSHFRGEKEIVAFYGYGDDIVNDLNEENLNKIFEYALRVKQFGKQICFNVDGKYTGAIEFIDEEPFTPERAKEIYREHRRSMGKWVLPCILECSTFDGSINFSVQVD